MDSQDFIQSNNLPNFVSTGLDSPITEFALALTTRKNDVYYPSGTAIIIGPQLALTARHVVLDYFSVIEDMPKTSWPPVNASVNFNLFAFQVLSGVKSGNLWNVSRIWGSNFTDIAILKLSPIYQSSLEYRWKSVRMDLFPPLIGERISAFGYSAPQIRVNSSQVLWGVDSKSSFGIVKEVHLHKRDNSRLNFPCFRTNARYDGSMSGGPVFNSSGNLCGLICSNMPPTDDSAEHVSYVASLWPIMGQMVDINRYGYPQGINYPLLELAKNNFISANGWKTIELNFDNKHNVSSIGINIPKPKQAHPCAQDNVHH